MTDKEKQIEEQVSIWVLKKIIRKELSDYFCPKDCALNRQCEACAELQGISQRVAEVIHNAGYRKMDDTIVILKPADITPEELARIMAEAHISAVSLPAPTAEIIDIEATCRENIKKVFEELNNYPYLERRQIRDFAEKYGVQLDDTP